MIISNIAYVPIRNLSSILNVNVGYRKCGYGSVNIIWISNKNEILDTNQCYKLARQAVFNYLTSDNRYEYIESQTGKKLTNDKIMTVDNFTDSGVIHINNNPEKVGNYYVFQCSNKASNEDFYYYIWVNYSTGEIKEESDYITTADGHKITASQMCEKFLFNGTLQYTHIKNLSGGEKRRLQLLRVLMMAPNVLLLDEPTNDLDIDTLSRLEDYLDDFNGVLICVSHDRYFLDRVCNKIFAYEGRGKINIYTGNYSDYLDYREQENIEFEEFEDKVKEEKPKAPKKEKPKAKNKPKFSYNEQREFDTIDEDIEKLEYKIASLEEDTSKYATDFTKLQEIMDEKTKLENELQVKYERWEYLNNLAEEIANWSNN